MWIRYLADESTGRLEADEKDEEGAE